MSAVTRRMMLHILRQPVVLSGLASLVVGVLALTGIAVAKWHPAETHRAVAESTAASLLAELKGLRHRQEMAELYRQRIAEAETLERKLKLVRSEPEFVAEIEALSASTRAELLQFSSRAAPNDKAAAETTVFEFSLKGDYTAIKAFLAGVRDLPEFVTVERVVLERMEPGLRARVLMKRRQARRA